MSSERKGKMPRLALGVYYEGRDVPVLLQSLRAGFGKGLHKSYTLESRCTVLTRVTVTDSQQHISTAGEGEGLIGNDPG